MAIKGFTQVGFDLNAIGFKKQALKSQISTLEGQLTQQPLKALTTETQAAATTTAAAGAAPAGAPAGLANSTTIGDVEAGSPEAKALSTIKGLLAASNGNKMSFKTLSEKLNAQGIEAQLIDVQKKDGDGTKNAAIKVGNLTIADTNGNGVLEEHELDVTKQLEAFNKLLQNKTATTGGAPEVETPKNDTTVNATTAIENNTATIQNKLNNLNYELNQVENKELELKNTAKLERKEGFGSRTL